MSISHTLGAAKRRLKWRPSSTRSTSGSTASMRTFVYRRGRPVGEPPVQACVTCMASMDLAPPTWYVYVPWWPMADVVARGGIGRLR
eukprot:6284663-Prymnesium_polylepis.1